MGPSILFDKSVIQSLGPQAVSEINRYFYTTVPHVLLCETLADLSLHWDDADAAKARVMHLARKVLPGNSIVNIHYQVLCVKNLLGYSIPMDRRPVVGGGKTVVAKDGSKGVYIGVQPENDAVLRWASGQTNEDDMKFAIQWREAAQGTNLEAMKRELPKPPLKLQSLSQVAEFVDIMLADPESQEPLLRWFLGLLRCEQPVFNQVCFRWKLQVIKSLRAFAPYAVHCLRVQLVFYIGMSHGILSTKPSNIVDVEYLCYTPFAYIFCSGDKLHHKLAPLILGDDQSFVPREAMQESLNEMVALRKNHANAEPGENSLIRRLWLKHWGKPPCQTIRSPISEEESERLMESIGPIVEALREQDQGQQTDRRFPM